MRFIFSGCVQGMSSIDSESFKSIRQFCLTKIFAFWSRGEEDVGNAEGLVLGRFKSTNSKHWFFMDFMDLDLLSTSSVPSVLLPPRPKNQDFCKKNLSDGLETLRIDRTHALNISWEYEPYPISLNYSTSSKPWFFIIFDKLVEKKEAGAWSGTMDFMDLELFFGNSKFKML